MTDPIYDDLAVVLEAAEGARQLVRPALTRSVASQRWRSAPSI